MLLGVRDDLPAACAQERVDEMMRHLAGLAEERIILSFAPSTPYYEALKRIGELFPKGAKVPRPPPAAHSACLPMS